MKRLVKVCAVTGLALSVFALTTPKAQAWGGGWPVAAGVFGGLAVGTCIGAAVAHASTPVYVYPPAVAVAPTAAYVAPAVVAAPAPQIVVAAPVVAAPVVYARPYPYYYYRGYHGPVVRYGYGYGYGRAYGWGRGYHYYRR
jgi:hypothetical protein